MSNKRITKTKILATIGPASKDFKIIKDLIKAGVDGFRINFSHAKYSELDDIIFNIRKASTQLKIPIAILGDLQGPKVRIGEIINGSIEIKNGHKISITPNTIIGNEKIISTSYANLHNEVKINECILIDDGLLKLKVISIDKRKKLVHCEVCEGGILKSKKGMNLPNTKLKTSALTAKDIEFLEYAVKNSFDFLALSFVKDKNDILRLRNILNKKNSNIFIIAKIELIEGVKNFEEILDVSDGIMIARGDLGVEAEPQEVPLIQKKIIKRCNENKKLVITATQMLESMVNNPLPTRAEASDIANSVYDGTDVVMLSAETSVGKYPERAVSTMNKILSRTEEVIEDTDEINFEVELRNNKIIHAVAKAVTFMSDQIKAYAIIPITQSGYTAIILSKYKPFSKILAITPNEVTTRKLNLYRGVKAFYLPQIKNVTNTIQNSIKLLKKEKEIVNGNNVIFVGSLTTSNKGVQNLIKVEKI